MCKIDAVTIVEIKIPSKQYYLLLTSLDNSKRSLHTGVFVGPHRNTPRNDVDNMAHDMRDKSN